MFDDILLDLKIRGFYLHKNFLNSKYELDLVSYKNHLIGYNFFIVKSDLKKYLSFF